MCVGEVFAHLFPTLTSHHSEPYHPCACVSEELVASFLDANDFYQRTLDIDRDQLRVQIPRNRSNFPGLAALAMISPPSQIIHLKLGGG